MPDDMIVDSEAGPSSANPATSPSTTVSSSSSSSHPMDADREPPPQLHCYSDVRLRFRELVRGYFYQLTVGCGDASCKNARCRSSGCLAEFDRAKAFEEASVLAKAGFRKPKPVYYFCSNLHYPIEHLHLDVLSYSILSDHQSTDRALFVARVRCGFQFEPLMHSFLLTPDQQLKSLAEHRLSVGVSDSPSYSSGRISDGSGSAQSAPSGGVDVDGLLRAYALIETEPEAKTALVAALAELVETMNRMLEKPEAAVQAVATAEQLRPFFIVLVWKGWADTTHSELLGKFFQVLCGVPKPMRKLLVQWISDLDVVVFHFLVVHVLQNFITLNLLTSEFIEPVILYATVVLGMLYDANRLVGGEGKIDHKEFYNDAVNNVVDIQKDYHRYRSGRTRGGGAAAQDVAEDWKSFSFVRFPFILDPAAKAQVLQSYALSQQGEVQHQVVTNMLLSGLTGGGGGMDGLGGLQSLLFPQQQPHLELRPEDLVCILQVDRNNLVQSTLQQAIRRSADLKKPLKIKFIGEDGIDEGGVKKEFFQLLGKELFDPQYGMFTYDEKSRLHWFNPHALESRQEFRLIGILFGLAIYNGVILEIRFPMAVYKKMLGMPVGLADLRQLDPELHQGLTQLLRFEETPDQTIEVIYDRTFTIHSNVYGAEVQIPLKLGGESIPLTGENREEYVQLYVKHILEDSIKTQFSAFHEGFQQVCGTEILSMFGPEELELLICGSPDLDFTGLEKECRYDGYTKDSPIVRQFWEIVHGLNEEEKKQFLKFMTGSDRVPIKGLSAVVLIIAKHGSDSEQLPVAHTCFNHLLLPPYSSKEKLREKLLYAIQNCTGFGLR